MNRMIRIFSVCIAAAICVRLLLPAPLRADVCEEDRQKFCNGYSADNPMRLYCLKRNETQIKPSCKSTLRTVPGSEVEFYDTCVEEVEKFCADVRPGKGRILKCLKANSKDLEFECRKMVSAFPNG